MMEILTGSAVPKLTEGIRRLLTMTAIVRPWGTCVAILTRKEAIQWRVEKMKREGERPLP